MVPDLFYCLKNRSSLAMVLSTTCFLLPGGVGPGSVNLTFAWQTMAFMIMTLTSATLAKIGAAIEVGTITTTTTASTSSTTDVCDSYDTNCATTTPPQCCCCCNCGGQQAAEILAAAFAGDIRLDHHIA